MTLQDSLLHCHCFISRFYLIGNWSISIISLCGILETLFYQSWWEKGLWSVMHILDNIGMISFEIFCSRFKLTDRKQYNIIIKAIILQSIIQMSLNLSQCNVTPSLPKLLVKEVSLTKLNNITTRKAFLEELYLICLWKKKHMT